MVRSAPARRGWIHSIQENQTPIFLLDVVLSEDNILIRRSVHVAIQEFAGLADTPRSKNGVITIERVKYRFVAAVYR